MRRMTVPSSSRRGTLASNTTLVIVGVPLASVIGNVFDASSVVALLADWNSSSRKSALPGTSLSPLMADDWAAVVHDMVHAPDGSVPSGFPWQFTDTPFAGTVSVPTT